MDTQKAPASLKSVLERGHWKEDWPPQTDASSNKEDKKGKEELVAAFLNDLGCPHSDTAGAPFLAKKILNISNLLNNDASDGEPEMRSTPVSQQEMWDAIKTLDDWNAGARPKMTWPPTEKGFTNAVLSVSPTSPPETKMATMLVIGMNAALVKKTLLDKYKVDKKAVSHYRKVTKLLAKNHRNNAPKPKYKHKAPDTEDRRWLKGLIEEAQSRDEPAPVKSEWFAAEVLANENNESGSWLNEKFLPQLFMLSEGQLDEFNKLWPENLRLEFKDPIKWANSPIFWGAFKNNDSPNSKARRIFPNIVDTEAWSDKTRATLLKQMIKLVKKDKDKLRARVSVWESLGGDLEAPCPSNGPTQSKRPDKGETFVTFEGSSISGAALKGDPNKCPSSKDTMLEWLKGSGNAMWKDFVKDIESNAYREERPSKRRP